MARQLAKMAKGQSERKRKIEMEGKLTAAGTNPGLEVDRGVKSGPMASGRSVSWPSAVHANVLMCGKSDECLSIRSMFCSLPTFYEGNHCLLNDYLSRHRCEGEPNKRALGLSGLPLLGIRSVGINYLMMNSVIINFNTQEQRCIISQCTAPAESLQTTISSSNAAEDFLQTCSGEKKCWIGNELNLAKNVIQNNLECIHWHSKLYIFFKSHLIKNTVKKIRITPW